MRRYHVTVVSHGKPEKEEIEAFGNISSGNWATVHKPWLDPKLFLA
jgi:hypothetical protein